jgi:hypothetical protein
VQVGRLRDRRLSSRMPPEGEGANEDAERHREYSAMAQEGARTAGDGDGGDGHEVPGRQLHSSVLREDVKPRGRDGDLLVRQVMTSKGGEPNFYR